MPSIRKRVAVAGAAAIALTTTIAMTTAHAVTPPRAGAAGPVAAPADTTYTAAEVLAGVKKNSTAANQVNTKPHINTMTRAMNVNVYQVASGVFAYTSSMAIDTDGSDSDPDPDHQSQTTWTDDNGAYLGAHHVPYYVLGDYCYDKTS